MTQKTKVLFVCLGNICRSPTAQGVFEKMVEDRGLSDNFYIDSAGTSAFHVGSPADERSAETALKYGYDLSKQSSRKVEFSDFIEFDYILAMDSSNYSDLIDAAPTDLHKKISLMLTHGTLGERDVPDPYYGGAQGFDNVLKLLENACEGFLRNNFNI